MPLFTPDGRYLVVRERLWRASNPALADVEREQCTDALMHARRAIRDARKAGEMPAEKHARRDVHAAKIALGERGPVWWRTDGSPDVNRRMVANTEYAAWWETVMTIRRTIFELLNERDVDATICPSEVARAMTTDGWRALMPLVRDVAREMMKEGSVEVRQKGERVDVDAEWRGPVQIGRVDGAGE